MSNSPPDDRKANEESASSAGSATGTARATDSPPLTEESAAPSRSRSDRVMAAIPIEVCGTDLKGVRFTESCLTEMVSRHGASIALPRRMSLEHPLILRRRALSLEVPARILGQLGIRPGFHIYGLTFVEDSPNFWGIHFPPLDENDDSLARTLLMCPGCAKKVVFSLNEIEFRVFDANQRLAAECETCGHNVAWVPVPHLENSPATSSDIQLQDRKHLRTKMKAMACIQEAERPNQIVEVLDISRGGISFRGSHAYEINSWIHFAVPYTPGAANIFIAGPIAWRKDLPGEHYEHGVQYVKG